MENIVQKISDELENNPELTEDINDIGLPKSSLNSFVKEFLTKNKVRGDKNIIPMLDKISRYYVTFISKVGAQICEDCKKKTLNLEHIFEALKQLKFNKHIELLVNETKKSENEEGGDPINEGGVHFDDEKKFENKSLKQMINKKKKRGSRKKKMFDNEEERKKMIELENEIFEKARKEMDNEEGNIHEDESKNNEEENINENENENKDVESDRNEDDLKEDDKEKNAELEKLGDNFFKANAEDEDINFDDS